MPRGEGYMGVPVPRSPGARLVPPGHRHQGIAIRLFFAPPRSFLMLVYIKYNHVSNERGRFYCNKVRGHEKIRDIIFKELPCDKIMSVAFHLAEEQNIQYIDISRKVPLDHAVVGNCLPLNGIIHHLFGFLTTTIREETNEIS